MAALNFYPHVLGIKNRRSLCRNFSRNKVPCFKYKLSHQQCLEISRHFNDKMATWCTLITLYCHIVVLVEQSLASNKISRYKSATITSYPVYNEISRNYAWDTSDWVPKRSYRHQYGLPSVSKVPIQKSVASKVQKHHKATKNLSNTKEKYTTPKTDNYRNAQKQRKTSFGYTYVLPSNLELDHRNTPSWARTDKKNPGPSKHKRKTKDKKGEIHEPSFAKHKDSDEKSEKDKILRNRQDIGSVVATIQRNVGVFLQPFSDIPTVSLRNQSNSYVHA